MKSLEKGQEAQLLVLGFCCVALLAATRLALTFAHFAADPNEGWNAVHAIIAMGGGKLYPPAVALTGNNYPPISFYVTGWLGELFGDYIVAGRLLSVASILGTAALIFLAARQIAHQSRAASYAALLFLLYSTTLFRSYFDLNDPQWLAHVFEVAALATLPAPDSTSAPSTRRIVMAALLFVLSGFIKQNLVGIPCAVTICLAIADRRSLAVWLASGLIFVSLGFATCYVLYGAPFFPDVLLTPRSYSVGRAVTKAAPILLAMAPLIVVTLSAFRRAGQDFRILLVIVATILCLATSVIQRAGSGVDINAHFETLIVLSIGCAVALSGSPNSGSPNSGSPNRGRLLLWLFAPFIVLVPLAGIKAYQSISEEHRERAAWHAMEAQIRSIPGPVACENLAYCYWAGKGYELDFFLYNQRILVGAGTQALGEVLRKHALRAAEIRLPAGGRDDRLSALLYADRDKVLYRQGDRALVSLR